MSKSVVTEELLRRCKLVFEGLVGPDREEEYIGYEELRAGLGQMGLHFESENQFNMLLSEYNISNFYKISYDIFVDIYMRRVGEIREENDEDTVEAFVALGGERDLQGQIVLDNLVKIIRDFNMTIDIPKLVEQLDKDGSGTIDYSEFRELLSVNLEKGATD